MRTGQFRDLTEEEIRNLSLELKIAFFIQPWNNNANIKTLDDWYNTFWIFFSREDVWASNLDISDTRRKVASKKLMEEEFTRHLNFYKELLKGE